MDSIKPPAGPKLPNLKRAVAVKERNGRRVSPRNIPAEQAPAAEPKDSFEKGLANLSIVPQLPPEKPRLPPQGARLRPASDLSRRNAIDSVHLRAVKTRLEPGAQTKVLHDLIRKITGHDVETLAQPLKGDYLLVQSEHAGTFGAFYYAVDHEGNSCGIKEMLSGEELDAIFKSGKRASVQGETTLVSALREDNIAQILAPGLQARPLVAGVDRRKYLVTKLMDGPVSSLFAKCQPDDKFWMGRTILREMADKLGFIHSKGYSHSDVKVENALWNRDGSIEIADFGMATQKPNIGRVGTYLTPEMVIGDRRSGKPADVFALAISLARSYHSSPPEHLFHLGGTDSERAQFVSRFTSWRNNELNPSVKKFMPDEFDEFFEPFKKTDTQLYTRVVAGMLDPNPETRMTMQQASRLPEGIGFADTAHRSALSRFKMFAENPIADTAVRGLKTLFSALKASATT